MSCVSLRIEGDGATASGYRVFLDGQDVSNFTRELSLGMSVDEVNTATLTVYVDRLEVSAETRAKLVAADVGRERTSFAHRIREWLS